MNNPLSLQDTDIDKLSVRNRVESHPRSDVLSLHLSEWQNEVKCYEMKTVCQTIDDLMHL